MCDFGLGMKEEFVKSWRRGYKITRDKKTGWSVEFAKARKNGPMHCEDGRIGRVNELGCIGRGNELPKPTVYNYIGFYLYPTLKEALRGGRFMDGRIEEVWYKGSVVYGRNAVGYKGLRAEWIVFRPSRRVYRRVHIRALGTSKYKRIKRK